MSDAIADAPSRRMQALARLLLAEASPETVRAVLRLLVNDVLPAKPAPVRSPSASLRRLGRKQATQRATTTRGDAEWEALRRRGRGAMRERGVDYADLAAAVGCSAATAKVSVNRRLPPSPRLLSELRAWLEAPGVPPEEVAAPALPFRARGGNGSREESAVTRVHTGTAG